MSKPLTDKGREQIAEKAWRAFTKHFRKCRICRNRDSEWAGQEQFCAAGRELFMSVALMDDDRERLEVWAALVSATPQKQFWEKVEAAAKSAGEFVAGIVAIVAVLYGFSWVADDIFAHVHINANHYWWAYRVWHAWWWVIVPLLMTGIDWPFRRRALGGGLWAVGAMWMVFIAGILLFVELLYHASQRVGFFGGSVLSCLAVLLPGLGFVAVGRLVNEGRSRLRR